MNGLNDLARMTVEEHSEVGLFEGYDPGDVRHVALVAAQVGGEAHELVDSLRRPVARRSEKIPAHTEEEEEAADVLIRLLAYAGWRGLDLDGAFAAKLRYNRGHGRRGRRF